MRRYSARMKIFLSLLLSMLLLATAPARAEEFYVELGRANSEAEANSAWAALLEANPKILGKYTLYPNQIIQPDGNATYRVQGGPMATKQEAERVCRRLFRKQVSCFVIEGFDPTKAKSFATAEDKSPSTFGLGDFLPWTQSSAQEAPKPPMIAAPEVKPEPKKETPKVEEAPKAKAKVDVAEAIAVPVTESNEVTVGEPTQVFSFDNLFSSAPESAGAATDVGTPGWLSIQPFLNEESANAFWKNLKKRKLDELKDITMKVIHPTVSHDIPKVILVLGSFSSEQVAMKFCNDYVASSRYLECMFSAVPPEGEEAGKGIVRNDSHSAAADEYSLFWVDVLSEKSQDKALERWERIRTDNDDLLSDVRSQITTSMANPGTYIVRIGPLKMKSRANKLCSALAARKIECKVSSL